MNIQDLIQKWYPQRINPLEWQSQLLGYYSTCESYCAMNAGEEKTNHPQVRLLQCLVKSNGRYLEIGCGSGVVCRTLSSEVDMTGVDYSSIAIQHASSGASENCRFVQADAVSLPFRDAQYDGVCSFEMLEHIVDPKKAIDEMRRVLRPGGFLLLSIPNRFSLDMHLAKNLMPRLCELGIAFSRLVINFFTDKIYCSIKPDFADPPYPDCDMISALFPDKMVSYLKSLGFRVEFCDTYYMRAHSQDSQTDLDFQRKSSHWFYKYFGDHILLLAIKGA